MSTHTPSNIASNFFHPHNANPILAEWEAKEAEVFFPARSGDVERSGTGRR